MTALDVQWLYLEAAARWLDSRGDDPEPEATTEVMTLWEDVLTRLGRDVMSCAGCSTGSPSSSSSRASGRATGWLGRPPPGGGRHPVGRRAPREGLVHGSATGRRLVDSCSPERSGQPDHAAGGHQGLVPRDLRAASRPQVFSASWDSVVFDVPGHASLSESDPRARARHEAQVGTLLDRARRHSALRDLATPTWAA